MESCRQCKHSSCGEASSGGRSKLERPDPPVDRVGFAPARCSDIMCAHPLSTCHRRWAHGHGVRVIPGVAYILKRQPPQAGHLGTHASFLALASGYGPGHAAHRGQSSIMEKRAKKRNWHIRAARHIQNVHIWVVSDTMFEFLRSITHPVCLAPWPEAQIHPRRPVSGSGTHKKPK
jgi:hypothetical protein